LAAYHHPFLCGLRHFQLNLHSPSFIFATRTKPTKSYRHQHSRRWRHNGSNRGYSLKKWRWGCFIRFLPEIVRLSTYGWNLTTRHEGALEIEMAKKWF
jgi:hypothetical protein